jgi:hypothetical protein
LFTLRTEEIFNKTLNDAKVREKVQQTDQLLVFVSRGLLARQGASLEMSYKKGYQLACGLSGPRGFKSPSRRHFPIEAIIEDISIYHAQFLNSEWSSVQSELLDFQLYHNIISHKKIIDHQIRLN